MVDKAATAMFTVHGILHALAVGSGGQSLKALQDVTNPGSAHLRSRFDHIIRVEAVHDMADIAKRNFSFDYDNVNQEDDIKFT
jgi:hypothetical protein